MDRAATAFVKYLASAPATAHWLGAKLELAETYTRTKPRSNCPMKTKHRSSKCCTGRTTFIWCQRRLVTAAARCPSPPPCRRMIRATWPTSKQQPRAGSRGA